MFLGYPRQLVVTRSQRRAAEKPANPFRPHQATLCTLRCQAVCIITFELHNDKYNNKINKASVDQSEDRRLWICVFVSRGSLIAIGKINAKWDLWVISI